MFSRRVTPVAAIFAPIISAEKLTFSPNNSDKRLAIGARDNSGLRSPFGRPRCAVITTDAPCASKYLIVGSEALIRPSSVITPSFNGTFKSQRSRTRFPRTSTESRVLIFIKASCLHIQRGQLNDLSNPIRCHTNQQPLRLFQLPW